ncbi:hypothetical protein GCM10027048_35900 [Hymenobacter coalescens]
MLSVLLLDKPPVYLAVGAGFLPAYEVRPRDWGAVPEGAAVAALDTGEGLDHGPRIVWIGTVVSNHMGTYSRGALSLVLAEPAPHDDPTMRLEADGIKRLYLLPALPAKPAPAALLPWVARAGAKRNQSRPPRQLPPVQ